MTSEKVKQEHTKRLLIKNNDTMVMIHEAAQGQIQLVCLIENTIQDKCVPLYAYSNYLFQLALCIELLIKTIILKEKDCIKEHDLKKLFDFLPENFKEEIYKSRGRKIIEDTLEISKNMFIELRYLENYGDPSLNLFLNTKAINSNNTVCMKKISKLESLKNLILLRDELVDFHNAVWKKAMEMTKTQPTKDNYDEFHKNLEFVQKNMIKK
jgi:hypothetical protein